MNATPFVLALAAPAIVAAAEPEAAAQQCATLQEIIERQGAMEVKMLTLQNPAPVNEDKISQIGYLFELCHSMNEAIMETSKGITSKETADEKAIELAGRCHGYMGICFIISFTAGNVELTEEEAAQLLAFIEKERAYDEALVAEMKRLHDCDYYGSDLLKAAMNVLVQTSTPQASGGETEEVHVEAE